MKQIFITHADLITPQAVLRDHHLQIQDGQITAIFKPEQLPIIPADATHIDAQGAYVAPGLIDTHIHGYKGFGPELGTEESLLQMSTALADAGVAAFCPTLYCAKPQEMLQIITQTVGAFGKETGARLLGYHLEGPFLSPTKPGVMKPQDITPIDLTILEKLYTAAQGHIASMTVAPELPGIEQLVQFASTHHILLQAGHTNATYEEFLRGVSLGITHTTHLFNAMSPLHHRAPGAVGAVLFHENISAEIIADGGHVYPDLVNFLRRVKPIENIVLVTDALLPTGQTKPPFFANGEEIILEGGVWKRKTDKVLAGSALTMLNGVKNLVAFGFTLPEAIACATANPARLLGLENQGTLAVGQKSELIFFDRDFRLTNRISA